MFIFNVLPLREFRSPKSQFAMVNVCVLSMYYHVLSFRSLTIAREPKENGANQPDFAQFAHNFHESREIR